MNTIELLTSAREGGATPAFASGGGSAVVGTVGVDVDAVGDIGRDTYDSLAWTYRNGFGDVLGRIPASTWLNPEGQDGWRRIKANSLREVWRAPLGGRVFFVKYYRINGPASRLRAMLRGPACLAEWNSGIYALGAGIAAVQPAGYAVNVRRQGGTQSLLVTEGVEPAQPLNEFWASLASDVQPRRRREDARQVIELLGEMIARAHQAGFEHMDMHAANILVQPTAIRRYRTLFVDLHSARLGGPLSDRAVVRNLAQLNQWFRRHASIGDRIRFLRAYFRWRNEYEQAFEHARPLELTFEQLVKALVDEADTHAQRLWAQRDRRVRRSGRYFSRIRLPGRWRGSVFVRCKQPLAESRASTLVLDKAWWRRQLASPLRWFDSPDKAEACKDSHSAMVARAVLDHPDGRLPVILKRPRLRNWRRTLAQLIGGTRTMRAWRMGHALLHRDIAAARPLAAVERRIGPFATDSLLMTEAVPGAVDLEAALRREHAERLPRDWFAYKRDLLRLLVRHVRLLQDRGFAHRDCKAGNILVVEHPQRKLLWIDMDGLRHVRRLSRSQMLRPLMRLHVSLLEVPGLTRTDRVRFLRAFFARFGVGPREWRAAHREIARLSERKLAAAQTRRAWKLQHYGRA